MIYVLNIGFGRSSTSVFESEFEESDSKIVSWYQLTLLAAVYDIENFLRRKITVCSKLNLKTDGLS